MLSSLTSVISIFRAWSCQCSSQPIKINGADGSHRLLEAKPRGYHQYGAIVPMPDDKHHWFWRDLITEAHMLQGLSVLTSGEMCLPAVAALFIIKPGMFQCRMCNLAFDKAWALCCQPPSEIGMRLVFCKEQGLAFDHKWALAFRNWRRWWLGIVELFEKWVESTAFNLSIWSGVGFVLNLDLWGNFTCWASLLALMETEIFLLYKLLLSSSCKSPKSRRERQADKKALSLWRHHTAGSGRPFLKKLWSEGPLPGSCSKARITES